MTDHGFLSAIEPLAETGGEMMSTLIDKWMEQGREQGLEQGRIEDRRNSIVDILAARFHDVPESIRDTVHRISDSQRLVRLTSIAATCESIDQFAESLT